MGESVLQRSGQLHQPQRSLSHHSQVRTEGSGPLKGPLTSELPHWYFIVCTRCGCLKQTSSSSSSSYCCSSQADWRRLRDSDQHSVSYSRRPQPLHKGTKTSGSVTRTQHLNLQTSHMHVPYLCCRKLLPSSLAGFPSQPWRQPTVSTFL